MARPSGSYRPPKELPFRLRQQSIVFFNERQYLQGLQFLNQLLTAGNSNNSNTIPAYVPLPQQLALAATLAVHPQFTTRARYDEDLHIANKALEFLQNANTILGPIHGNFSSGFAFESFFNSRRRVRRTAGSPSHDSDEEEAAIRSAFANEKCLFSQLGVDDIWQIIGWAFNCSITWERRWERWKLWLQLLLDVLEDDWEERAELVRKTGSDQHFTKSLIIQYLSNARGRTERRRIMRAVLADGTEKSLLEFHEVFENETKERRISVVKQKELNLENDQWGDYDVDEDDDEIADSPTSKTGAQTGSARLKSSDHFGGSESIHLRQRLLTLLARVAGAPSNAFTDLEDLFDLFTESFRGLPLPTFTQFIATFRLPHETLNALLVNLLIPYIPSAPKKLNIFSTSQETLVNSFLPYSANVNSSVDNAKMSLVIETLLSSMMSEGRLKADEQLSNAVVEGNNNRKKKAIGDARRKFKGRKEAEAEARRELEMSSERILAILDILEMEAGISPRQRLPDALSSPLSSSVSLSSTRPDNISSSEESDMEDVIHVKID